jgi:hypothetical protein
VYLVPKYYHDAWRLVANLPLRPLVAKVFKQFPGDFGAMGQDPIVIQSFILLNAKKHFSGLAARSVCQTNVHLAADLQKAIFLRLKGRTFSGWM